MYIITSENNNWYIKIAFTMYKNSIILFYCCNDIQLFYLVHTSVDF